MNKRKLIYSILKEIESGNKPSYLDYKDAVTLEEFGSVVEMMGNAKLISSYTVVRGGKEHSVLFVNLNPTKLEMPGLSYLEENSAWSKLYGGLKEAVSWIKL